MNSYNLNQTIQNQRLLYPNYIPGLTANPIQFPDAINNSIGNTPQYNLPHPIRENSNVPGYNPVNMIPSQIYPTNQILVPKSNIITSPPIQNTNLIQPQEIKTIPIYNQSKITNLVKIPKNHIPINNNINISYSQGIISNQNMIQGKSNQVNPLYGSNIYATNLNSNIINSENNLTKNINKITNKNNIIQNKKNS